MTSFMKKNNMGNKVYDNAIDHYENVVEELKLNGFDVKLIHKLKGYGYLIEYDTIAGRMKYSCSEKTPMGDYYRFISHLGSKLHIWGLEHKIEVSHE